MDAGCETAADGGEIGRDPSTMTAAELAALGHGRKPPLKALRERCLDCCAGSAHEVRCCTATKCPAWPFRLGKIPWSRPISEKQRAAGRAAAARRHGHDGA